MPPNPLYWGDATLRRGSGAMIAVTGTMAAQSAIGQFHLGFWSDWSAASTSIEAPVGLDGIGLVPPSRCFT